MVGLFAVLTLTSFLRCQAEAGHSHPMKRDALLTPPEVDECLQGKRYDVPPLAPVRFAHAQEAPHG